MVRMEIERNEWSDRVGEVRVELESRVRWLVRLMRRVGWIKRIGLGCQGLI